MTHPDDPTRLTRRHFLATTSLLPAGLLLAGSTDEAAPDTPAASTAATPGGSHAPDDIADMPPRVVGLRSKGGAFLFDPPGLLVEPGTELHWLNMGDFHTATAFHPDYDDLLPAGVPLRIPEGAEPWHSGILGLTAGTRFSHRFTVEGVHDYFCQPHYSFGMVGRVVVGRAGDGPAVTTPLPAEPSAVRENMPDVEEIVGPAGVTFEGASRINGVLYRAADGDDPAPFAEAVARGMSGHQALQERAGDAAGRLDERMTSFRDTAASDEGYEVLLRSADALKEVLREIHARPRMGIPGKDRERFGARCRCVGADAADRASRRRGQP